MRILKTDNRMYILYPSTQGREERIEIKTTKSGSVKKLAIVQVI